MSVQNRRNKLNENDYMNNNEKKYRESNAMYEAKSRENFRKQRKKTYKDEDEDEDEKEILPKWKLFLVIGAILVCFSLLFPTVFQPMINSFMGRGATSNQQKATRPPIGRHPTVPPTRGGPPLHPAAASAQMRSSFEANTNTQSGGRSMISWMMPIYTLGVVGFLVYTLYKIMFKKKLKKKKKHYYNDEEDLDESESDIASNKFGHKKMRAVQKRLQKTEEAMRQILEQLEAIAQVADATNIAQHIVKDEPGNVINNQENLHLNDQQVIEVEKGLRELKQLSDLYKEQQNEISESDLDEFCHSELITSDSEQENQCEFIEKLEKNLNLNKTSIQNDFNKENISNKNSNSELLDTTLAEIDKNDLQIKEKTQEKPIQEVNINPKSKKKSNVRRRIRRE